jgi:hypothetical protein
MSSAGFEHAIPRNEQPQTYAFDLKTAVIGTGVIMNLNSNLHSSFIDK